MGGQVKKFLHRHTTKEKLVSANPVLYHTRACTSKGTVSPKHTPDCTTAYSEYHPLHLEKIAVGIMVELVRVGPSSPFY